MQQGYPEHAFDLVDNQDNQGSPQIHLLPKFEQNPLHYHVDSKLTKKNPTKNKKRKPNVP